MLTGIPIKEIVLLIFIVILIVIFMAGYVKAPPDEAFIVSGFKKEPKILIGRSGFRIPFLERLDVLPIRA